MTSREIELIRHRFNLMLKDYFALRHQEENGQLVVKVLTTLSDLSPLYLYTGEFAQTFHTGLDLDDQGHVSQELARLMVKFKNDCGEELYEELCDHVVFSTDFREISDLNYAPAAWRLLSLRTEISESVAFRQERKEETRKGIFWKLFAPTPKKVDLIEVAKLYTRNNPHIVFTYMLMVNLEHSTLAEYIQP